MAIKIYEKFAPFANPADGDYPYGSFKNDSIPGAEDGTPLDAVWANDYAGTDAELFAQAGIVPNGQPDKIGASQRVDAMRLMFRNVGTVADIAAGKFKVGALVSVTDRAGGIFKIVSGGTADGFGVLSAGAGKTAVLVVDGSINPKWLGANGDGLSDDSAAMIIAAGFGVPIELPFGTYLLNQTINLVEPFDLRANNSFFKIGHSGIGFHLKSSNYNNKININSIKDANFIDAGTTPSVFIKIGVESLLEPTNIELDGLHFRGCKSSNALIENERSYGLKVTNSAINECLGVGIAFRSSALGAEDKYSYNCYVHQTDITGIGTGILIEGGKISVSDCVIESCTQSAIKMTGIQYSPVVYCDNVYFEQNALNFDCSVTSPEGYSLHSRIKDCFFGNGAVNSYASASYQFVIDNCKNFNISAWSGSPSFVIGDNPLPIEYTPRMGDSQKIIVSTPKRLAKSPLGATEKIQVPLVSVQRSAYQISASSKICITRTDGANVGYYEGIFIPTRADGTTFSINQVAGFSTGGGYPFLPTFSRNSSDAADMSLYVTFTGSGASVISMTVEGMTGG